MTDPVGTGAGNAPCTSNSKADANSKAITCSVILASTKPKQARGPAPNGKYALDEKFRFVLNVEAEGQWRSSRCICQGQMIMESPVSIVLFPALRGIRASRENQ